VRSAKEHTAARVLGETSRDLGDGTKRGVVLLDTRGGGSRGHVVSPCAGPTVGNCDADQWQSLGARRGSRLGRRKPLGPVLEGRQVHRWDQVAAEISGLARLTAVALDVRRLTFAGLAIATGAPGLAPAAPAGTRGVACPSVVSTCWDWKQVVSGTPRRGLCWS